MLEEESGCKHSLPSAPLGKKLGGRAWQVPPVLEPGEADSVGTRHTLILVCIFLLSTETEHFEMLIAHVFFLMNCSYLLPVFLNPNVHAFFVFLVPFFKL